MKAKQKVIKAVQVVLTTILTVNAFRLLFGYAQGGAHPINVAASWFGAGPIMPDIETMSRFYLVDIGASIFSSLFICALSVVIPYKLIGLLYDRNITG